MKQHDRLRAALLSIGWSNYTTRDELVEMARCALADADNDGLPITPAQCRAARGLVDWTQHKLADESGVSIGTIRNFECGHNTPICNNMLAIRRALEDAGVGFINSNGSGLGVRFTETTD